VIGARFKSNGRRLTITGSYDGSRDPDDRPGYYYRFDGEHAIRWISASGMAVRFTPIDRDKYQPGDVVAGY